MIWVLLFCSGSGSIYSGAHCLPPVQYRERATCELILKQQIEVANRIRYGTGKCVGVRL